MSNLQTYWDTKHQKYAAEDWINLPTIFAQQCITYFPKQGTILDLGAGQGQDSRYFANLGYQVISTDFSSQALAFSQAKTPQELQSHLSFETLDLSARFPFMDNSFEIVYSHLAIQYFDLPITQQLFTEIYRVLKPQGIIALLVNSVNDPEYHQGQKLDDYLRQYDYGLVKRFFDLESTRQFTEKFTSLLLDQQGETHKDKKIGTHNLIRFIGKKP